MSLPRQHRLKSWRHFAQVYRRGGRWRSRCVILRGLQVTNTPDPITTQIGISIGRKTSKRAVVRNRLKRQVRHAFRQLLPQLESGWLLVAVLPPQALGCEPEDFLRELEELLKKAEIIHGY